MTGTVATNTTGNLDQERFWNEVAGPLWVAAEEETECQTRPFGEAALALAAPVAGERVLDVGCGCGSTTVSLAEAVGAGGRVVGVDLSAPMLARAEQRAGGGEQGAGGGEQGAGVGEQGAGGSAPAQVEFRRADAGSADLGEGCFDLVFSRFGVMFFNDPVAGFANLRRALRSGGRMVFVCWQAPSANPWMAVVNRAAARIFDLDAPAADAPGPFSLADPERIRAVLGAAGFGTTEINDHHRRLHLGAGRPVEDWVERRLAMGPARAPYLDASPERQREVRAALVAAVADRQADPGDPLSGLLMEAAAWVVRARP